MRQRCTGDAVCLVRLCTKKILSAISLATSKEGSSVDEGGDGGVTTQYPAKLAAKHISYTSSTKWKTSRVRTEAGNLAEDEGSMSSPCVIELPPRLPCSSCASAGDLHLSS